MHSKFEAVFTSLGISEALKEIILGSFRLHREPLRKMCKRLVLPAQNMVQWVLALRLIPKELY